MHDPFTLSETDLEDIATGAWILGTGGGGDPYFSMLETKLLYERGARVSVIDPLSLHDDDLVCCVGKMGAPLVTQEKLGDGEAIAETIRRMEAYLGRRFKGVMIWEIGGANGFQAILASAILGLPVVDCDAMGRAFPQADMTTFAICDLPAYPWTMVDIRRNSIIFTEAEDWSWMERMTRRACTVFGSVAATCKAPRTGREVKTCTVLHTLVEGAAPRPHRARGAAHASRPGAGDPRCGRRRGVVPRQGQRRAAPHQRGLAARHLADRRPGCACRPRLPARIPERIRHRPRGRRRCASPCPT